MIIAHAPETEQVMTTPVLEPENWLTYRGLFPSSVGHLMGPGVDVPVATVVAADVDPAFVWPDGRTGRTRLGFVSGDARSEIGVSDDDIAAADETRMLRMVGLDLAQARAAGFAR